MATLVEQLEAMRALNENWDGYGAAAPEGVVLDLAREFVRLIEALLRRRGAFPGNLYASPTRTGGVLIEWEDGGTEHEVEINPDQSFSFLHLNKTTGHVETRKLAANAQAVVHPGLLQELTELLAA